MEGGGGGGGLLMYTIIGYSPQMNFPYSFHWEQPPPPPPPPPITPFTTTHPLDQFEYHAYLMLFVVSILRFSLVFSVCLFLYVGKCTIFVTPSPTPSLHPLKIVANKGIICSTNYHSDTKDGHIFQIFIFASGILSLLWLALLQLCNHVTYISFNTNLSTRRKEIIVKSPDCFWSYLSLNMLGLLLCECPDYSC